MNQVRIGLKENWKQFSLLVIINAFVGGMVGMERTILPEIAGTEFHVAAKTAILSFIIVFGIVKAFTNYFAGSLANKFGRKNLLVVGWLMGIPVPFIIMFAPDWNWIVAANILLGINQGLTWSSTVIMKIDLVGEKQRGFAMGLNEFAGYLALAIVAFLTGLIAGKYGLRPYPFYLGIGISILGLLLSWLFVKDTKGHVEQEAVLSKTKQVKKIFWETTWKHKNLGSVTQAGLVNNLNDGMVWGIFPVLLATKGFTLEQIGMITAIYPSVWGIGQVVTGKIADHVCKKDMLVWGMILQALALAGFGIAYSFTQFILVSFFLGVGTAMVYPTFLASIAENTHPKDRSGSLGIFRFWRDLGYAIGAIITGILADVFSIQSSIVFVSALTFVSGLIIFYRMKCNSDFTRMIDWLKRKITLRPNLEYKGRQASAFKNNFSVMRP